MVQLSANKHPQVLPAGLLPRDAGILSSTGFPAEYLFSALDHFDVGISVVNKRFRYRCVNRALARMDNLPQEAHAGKALDEVVGSLITEVEPILDRVFSSGQPLPNIRHCGRLSARTETGQWLKYYFPLLDIRSRVTEVGVFIVELKPSEMPALDCRARSGIGGVHARTEVKDDEAELKVKNGCGTFEPCTPGIHLSVREGRVLGLLAAGNSNKEISDLLGISVKTVETHRSRIMVKLRAPSLVHLVHYAIRHGIAKLLG
jgi:DNA-binding CsgD family transcriptional regulator